jgi:acyl-CoA reductase-like NAD-dependent aldehyde dehydrogenase
VVRELTQSTADEVAHAIEVAHNAFPAWSKTFTANKVSCDSHDVASLNG